MQFTLQPPNFEVMGTMFFNRKFEVGRLNFQGSFDYLCNNLPSTFTSENFLYNNTIFPLFIPFISKEKQEKAIEYFKGDYPDKINKCLRISDITKTKTYIRVCKECIKEDLATYGEPYFRRQHEIELNKMCYKHKTPLYEYTIFPYKIPRRYDDFCTVLKNSKELILPEKFKEKFLDIAEDINAIFASNLNNWNIEITKDKISNRTAEKGYVTVAGTTFQQKFSEDFKKYYAEEFLEYIGFNFNIDENDSWIRYATTRKKTIGNPTKYLLVIRYLFGSFKNFYEYQDNHSIFKDGPYPCLNKVCFNYNKLVINDCYISISHNHPLATLKCKYCGFTYSRRGPDKEDNDIYKKTYVKDFGHIWLKNLKEYAKQGFSLRKMSKLLGCTDLNTIKNYIKKVKLDGLSNNDLVNKIDKEPEIAIPEEDPLMVEKYKSMFLEILSEKPKMNSLLIYRKYPKAYKLVSKYDRNWIENNLLKKEVSRASNNNSRLKKYWKDKDENLYKRLIKSLEAIKAKQELYERITIILLQKHIGYSNLLLYRSKLPKCFKVIELECETIPQYQKRRVNYVMKQMADSNKKITFAKVLYDAGLRNRASKEVLDYIEVKINEYNQGNVIKN